jgi:hypothetical protein
MKSLKEILIELTDRILSLNTRFANFVASLTQTMYRKAGGLIPAPIWVRLEAWAAEGWGY